MRKSLIFGMLQLVVCLCIAHCGPDIPEPPQSSTGGGSQGTSSGTPQIDCTFPNDVSICGCGNACGDDGYCHECGLNGEGCVPDDIYCCSDSHCPTGIQCSSLGQSPNGYHVCFPEDPCTTSDDCYSGEFCVAGYCRDSI